jgi:hypothetical protein
MWRLMPGFDTPSEDNDGDDSSSVEYFDGDAHEEEDLRPTGPRRPSQKPVWAGRSWRPCPAERLAEGGCEGRA